MNGLGGVFSSAFNFIASSTMGKIILLIVVLAILLFVIIPIIRKLRRRQVKEQETREIMKDLLTWRHLAQMVKGRGGKDKAKQALSEKLIKINDLFKEGFKKYYKKEHNLYEHPWFIMLGEPRSGKSSLLEASDLEMESSTTEKDSTDDGNNSLPVRFYSNVNAVICDVSGKVFFDRWLESSSAE
ncbi:MAG: hypothetical protein LBV52_02320, partial [Spirochaetaceae bacterium]|nr:hypothetical protein [Spirochaetaceae bacterium]